MIAWTAYYDASRTQNDAAGVLQAVGIATTETKWLRFEREWKTELLTGWGIPYLHMKEFFSRPEFAHIREADKELECLECATRIIKKHTNLSYTVAVHLEGFREVDTTYSLSEPFLGPYAFTAGQCCDQLTKWIREKHGNPPLANVLEKGDLGQGQMLHELAKGSHWPVATLPKKDPITGEWVVPFQATDFIAWAIRRIYERAEVKKRLGPIPRMVHRLLPLKNLYYGRQELTNYCLANSHIAPLRIPRWGGD